MPTVPLWIHKLYYHKVRPLCLREAKVLVDKKKNHDLDGDTLYGELIILSMTLWICITLEK